jgi:hypothetical protein
LKKIVITIIVLVSIGMVLGETTKNPNKAALYSVIFPGGGQLYNHAWWKAGAVIGVQSYLISTAIYNQDKQEEYKKLAESTTDLYQQQIYQSQSKNYQDKFNNDLWWIGITAGLSVIDAYVDAHLYNFESEKQKILLHFSENGVVLQYKF